jgi:hypothetical protein
VRVSGQVGAAREGLALLAGLLRCRRCASKLTLHYTGGQHDAPRYTCHQAWLDKGQPRCISIGGTRVDAAVAQEVLRAVQPAAIEASILAHDEEAKKRDEMLAALQRDLQAARYAAQRAQRQFDAADPENRLVTDELERRWNQALQRVREVEGRIEQHSVSVGTVAAVGVEEFADLAAQLDALWHRPDADVRLKKRITRSLIQEVVVDVDTAASEIVLVVHWKGGVHTEVRVPRWRRGQNTTHTSKETIDAVQILARICPDRLITGILNRNGLRTGRGNYWTHGRVTALRSYHQIPAYSIERCANEGWMTLTQTAALIGVSPKTFRLAVERNEFKAEHPLADGPWIFNKNTLDTNAVTELVARARAHNLY